MKKVLWKTGFFYPQNDAIFEQKRENIDYKKFKKM
jgi:hypothetical protein